MKGYNIPQWLLPKHIQVSFIYYMYLGLQRESIQLSALNFSAPFQHWFQIQGSQVWEAGRLEGKNRLIIGTKLANWKFNSNEIGKKSERHRNIGSGLSCFFWWFNFCLCVVSVSGYINKNNTGTEGDVNILRDYDQRSAAVAAFKMFGYILKNYCKMKLVTEFNILKFESIILIN